MKPTLSEMKKHNKTSLLTAPMTTRKLLDPYQTLILGIF